MTRHLYTLLAVCFAALSGTGAANAGVITVTGMQYANPTTVRISSASPASTSHVYAGAFTTTDGQDTFASWCVEIFQHTYFNSPVRDYFSVAGETILGEQKADALSRLATEALDQVTNSLTSGAFQIAVWEIVNERPGTSYNLSAGNFKAWGASNASITLAQHWLNNLPATGNYTLEVLVSPTRQNLAVFSEVPEPGVLMLFGLGLAAIGVSRRAKRKG